MSDWLTYSLADFLMFGPEVYWRLFELQNRALWPLPVGAALLGVAMLAGVAASGRRWHRPVGLAIALCWAGAAQFLALRYAPINLPVEYAAWLFAAEAAPLAAAALCGRLTAGRDARWAGLGLLAYAVLLHPLVGLAFGRPLAQAELLGLAPDTTALATLGLVLLLARGWWRGALAVVPVGWCVTSAATLLTLGEAQGWILVGALVLFTIGTMSLATSDRG